MSAINVDLPDRELAEISRLAQELNVPRAEILRQAITCLAGRKGTEEALERLRSLYAEAMRDGQSLAARIKARENQLEEGERELGRLRELAGRDGEIKESLAKDRARLTAECEKARAENARWSRELETARRRRETMGKLLAERTYLAIRSLEVERLRAQLEKAITAKVRAEEDLSRQAAGTKRHAEESAKVGAHLAQARLKRAELLDRAKRQQGEIHRLERDIGKLRGELERARGELRRMVKLLGGAGTRP